MVRIIHCFWMGPEMPPAFKNNLERWKTCNPDFDIRLWTERNVDLSQLECANWDGKERNPSMVSDLVRLHKLWEHGGWWLDTDIELFRPLDSMAERGERMEIGYIFDCALGTAMFYAPPRHPYVAGLIRRYQIVRPDRVPVNNSVFTEYFVNEVPGFLLNGRRWENPLCRIFPKETFEQPSLPWQKGVAMHHCAGAWMGKKAGTDFLYNRPFPAASRTLKWAKRKIRTRMELSKNEFRPVFEAARNGRALRFSPEVYYQTGELECPGK